MVFLISESVCSSRIIPGNLTVAQTLNKYFPSSESVCSLPYLKEPYSEPNSHTLSKFHFNISSPSTLKISMLIPFRASYTMCLERIINVKERDSNTKNDYTAENEVNPPAS